MKVGAGIRGLPALPAGAFTVGAMDSKSVEWAECDWLELKAFFVREELYLAQVELRLEWADAFGRVSEGAGHGTEAAVRSYIARRDWPALEDTDRWELLLRLRYAQWFCEEHLRMGAGDRPHDGWTTLEALLAEWLIEFWRDDGRCEWLIALGKSGLS